MVTNDAVADVHTSISLPTVHTRLLIVTGIPTICDAEQVKDAIRRAAKPAGLHQPRVPSIAYFSTAAL